jgi:hypothetical protein
MIAVFFFCIDGLGDSLIWRYESIYMMVGNMWFWNNNYGVIITRQNQIWRIGIHSVQYLFLDGQGKIQSKYCGQLIKGFFLQIGKIRKTKSSWSLAVCFYAFVPPPQYKYATPSPEEVKIDRSNYITLHQIKKLNPQP